MKRDLIPLKYSLHITYQKKKFSSYGKFQLFELILGLSKRPITLWAHVKYERVHLFIYNVTKNWFLIFKKNVSFCNLFSNKGKKIT